MKLHLILLRALSAVVAFGSFAWCLGLVGTQLYRWFRDGAWTRISTSDGLISLVTSCCTQGDSEGRMAEIARWLEAPASWFGLHRVLDLLPASIGLFLLSVFGNFLYIYCSDRLDALRPVPSKK
jgi:hypothetical protein